MKTKNFSLSLTLLGIGAILILPASVAAQTGPSGSFTNKITGPTNAVWDFGSLITNVDISISTSDAQVELSFAATVQQTGAGKLSGSGTGVTVNLSDGSSTTQFAGSVKSTGSVTSTGPGAHVMLTTSVTGSAILPGDTVARKVSARLQVNGVIDNTNRTISGQSTSQASAAGKGSISETDNFGPTSVNAIPGIAPLGDGSWTLTMNVATAANKISGAAQVTLNSGQVLNYSIKGSFKSTTGLSKLVLAGSDLASKGSTLQVMMNGNTVKSISGRIVGQNVNANF